MGRKKKPTKKQLRIRKKIRSVGEKLTDLKDSTKGIRGGITKGYVKGPDKLESEWDETLCESSCIFKGHSELCSWYRDNKCSSKCNSRVLSYHQLGVDSRKIKYSATEDEKQLRKKINSYIGVARQIDEEVVQQEKEMEKQRLKKEAADLVAFLLNGADDEPEDAGKKEKYSNLDRLI